MKKTDRQRTESNSLAAQADQPASFFVVGIGASAGGIRALQEFFRKVREDSGMAYVLILHLSPDHDSQLASVLQRETTLPVMQVREKTKIQPDHVYVVPPDKHLSMDGAFIAVSPNLRLEERRAPVDIFFRSLADQYGPRAVSVVLSGTGANGSMGLKHIKELGGVTFVQNPREAEFNEMPRNAIATEVVDEVLNVGEIPDKILSFKTRSAAVEITAEIVQQPEDQQYALREIFTLIRQSTGHDFSNYKRPTLLRRIERRINVRGLSDLPAYATYLKTSGEEPKALLKDLLISVTHFFRDQKAFDAMEQEVIPLLLKGKNGDDQIRIWVAGCATGEEAYSFAILCLEKTAGMSDPPKIQVFATDIDEGAIAHAREGFYTINDLADVSAERLRHYFNKERDGYRIRREVREVVMFAGHNFLKDPPFSHLDLISCRNVLMYLNQVAQDRVMETFHFALNPGSYLFLGSSESVDGASEVYTSYSREHHIFQSRNVGARAYPVPDSRPSLSLEKFKAAHSGLELEPKPLERISFADLHHQLLEEYAPPSLVINEDQDIVHLSGSVGKYLQIGGGELSQNLLKLIKPELRLEVRSALYQAVQRHAAVEARGLKVNTEEGTDTVNVQVRPVLQSVNSAKGFMLLVFEPVGETNKQEVLLSSNEPIARQLEEELARTKLQLRSSNEQHDFQAEEMKAFNEELQAMNEELRSAAEELETSKEELQSINEELRTVNQELKVKIEETSIASNNLHNLINSTNIGTIFLDRSLRIVFFTPALRDIFNLRPADNGRPLSDITSGLEYKDLLARAATVLEKLLAFETEVSTTSGGVYLMRISPYRTHDDRINGVVISFVDITERKKLADRQAFMLALGDSLRLLTTSEEIQRHVVRTLGEHLHASRVFYVQLEADGNHGVIDADYTDGVQSLAGPHTLSDYDTETQKKWRAGKPAAFEDLIAEQTLNPDQRDAAGRIHVLARIGAPLLKDGWLAAVLVVEQSRPRAWLEEEIGLVKEVAARAWLAIERAKAEHELKISESRLQQIINIPLIGVLTFDFQGVILGANDAFLEMTGYARSEFEERVFSWRDFTPSEYVEATTQYFERVQHSRQGESRQTQYIKKDGTRRWIMFVAADLGDGTLVEFAIDVDDRKKMEDALRDSQSRLQLAAHAAKIGTFVFYPISDRSEPDQQMLFLVGLPEDGRLHLGSSLASIIHPEDRARYLQDLAGAMDPLGTGILDTEFRVFYQDGSQRWLNIAAQTFFEGNPPQPVKMPGVALDITERRQAQQALKDFSERLENEVADRTRELQENYELLQTIYNTTLVGMSVFSPIRDQQEKIVDFKIVTVNQEIMRTLGQDDIAGKLYAQSFPGIKQSGLFDLMVYTITTGEPGKMEYHYNFDSIDRWYSTMFVKGNDLLVSTNLDITERKLWEQTHMRDLVLLQQSENLAGSGSWDYDLLTGNLVWSEGMYHLFDLKKQESVRPDIYLKFALPEFTGAARIIVSNIESGDREFEETLEIRTSSAHKLVRTKATVIKDDRGQAIRVLGVDLDVTATRQAEEKLHQMATEQQLEIIKVTLRTQEEERRRISESLHNGLGQMLYGIKISLSQMSIKNAIDNPSEFDQSKRYTNDLLSDAIRDTRRISHELMPAVLEEFGLTAAIKDVCQQLQDGVKFRCSIELGETRIDKYMQLAVFRIIQELMINVVKHAHATKASADIRYQDQRLSIKVSDNGHGIDAQDHGKDGIGLASIRSKVNLLDGTMTIQSAGKGTTVQVALPYIPEKLA